MFRASVGDALRVFHCIPNKNLEKNKIFKSVIFKINNKCKSTTRPVSTILNSFILCKKSLSFFFFFFYVLID